MSQEFGNLAHIFELCQLLLNILLTNFNLRLKRGFTDCPTQKHVSYHEICLFTWDPSKTRAEVTCSATIKILHKDAYCFCEMNNSLQPASVFKNSPDHVGFKY